MAGSMAALVRELERLKTEFGGDATCRKLALLSSLHRGRLARAADVLALHEQLCFMRAYPDNAAVLERVEQVLHGFDRRSDLRRFAEGLADSGIAGTPTHYAFYAPTAGWLARRWGDRLHIDWKHFANASQLDELVQYFALWAETPGLDESRDGAREWIERMRGQTRPTRRSWCAAVRGWMRASRLPTTSTTSSTRRCAWLRAPIRQAARARNMRTPG